MSKVPSPDRTPATTALRFEPARTVLVLMDFQLSILATLPNSEDVVQRGVIALAVTREAGVRVAFIRVAFTSDELLNFPDHSVMGKRMNALADKVLIDSPFTQIDPRLALRHADLVLRKRRVGPFSTTDLDERLKKAGIDTLVLAGVHTSGCVLSCVREAYDLDYRLIVLSDACADPDEGSHEFLTNTLFPKQSIVITVAAYAQALTDSQR